MNRLKRLQQIIKIWRLKRKANKLAKKNKTQYFVILWKGKPEILSKDGFKLWRQKGIFPLSFTAAELREIAIHTTKK